MLVAVLASLWYAIQAIPKTEEGEYHVVIDETNKQAVKCPYCTSILLKNLSTYKTGVQWYECFKCGEIFKN